MIPPVGTQTISDISLVRLTADALLSFRALVGLRVTSRRRRACRHPRFQGSLSYRLQLDVAPVAQHFSQCLRNDGSLQHQSNHHSDCSTAGESSYHPALLATIRRLEMTPATVPQRAQGSRSLQSSQ